jgi:hypothetical protein
MAKSGLASDLGVLTWNISDQSGSPRVSEISYRGLRLGRVRNRMDSRCLRCRPYSTDSNLSAVRREICVEVVVSQQCSFGPKVCALWAAEVC